MKSESSTMACISSSLLEKHKGLLTWSPQVDTSDRENRTSPKVQLPKMCGLFSSFFFFFKSAGHVTLHDLSQVSHLALWPPKLLADVYTISLKLTETEDLWSGRNSIAVVIGEIWWALCWRKMDIKGLRSVTVREYLYTNTSEVLMADDCYWDRWFNSDYE